MIIIFMEGWCSESRIVMSIGVIPQFSPRYNYCWWPGVTSDQQPSGIWGRRPGASEETRVWVSCNFPWPLLSWQRLLRDHCTSLISLSRYLSRVTRGRGRVLSSWRDHHHCYFTECLLSSVTGLSLSLGTFFTNYQLFSVTCDFWNEHIFSLSGTF